MAANARADENRIVKVNLRFAAAHAGKDYVCTTDLAKGCSALGEKDKAFAWLEKAGEGKTPDVLSIKYAPASDFLRGDPRFQKLIEKMNFPQ